MSQTNSELKPGIYGLHRATHSYCIVIIIVIVIPIFFGQLCTSKGERRHEVNMKQGETPCPALCAKCVGSLTSPADHIEAPLGVLGTRDIWVKN